GFVRHQNDHCIKVCGDQKEKLCGVKDGCMQMRTTSDACPAFGEGVQLFRNRVVGETYHDVVVIADADNLTTLLYPLDAKYAKEMEFLAKYGLSPRETEIMALVIKGESNTRIAKKLHISTATLKTHLNNVYRKLPPAVSEDFKKRATRKDRF